MDTLSKIIRKINTKDSLKENEAMSKHTSFKVGGPADYYFAPSNVDSLIEILKTAKNNNLPYFILGEGANILVSDKGIRGIVIDMSKLNDFSFKDNKIIAEAGKSISELSYETVMKGFKNLEFIYAMPGSVGGSVYMNARCYGTSISERIEWVEIINSNLKLEKIYPDKKLFDYKKSPFQGKKNIIVKVCFNLKKAENSSTKEEMLNFKKDRENKGHFQYPCAGSVFKNNRDFGKPSGELIDNLGLKNFSIGGAKIAPFHANIIINYDNANAVDIKKTIEHVESEVFNAYGYKLEREVILIGEW